MKKCEKKLRFSQMFFCFFKLVQLLLSRKTSPSMPVNLQPSIKLAIVMCLQDFNCENAITVKGLNMRRKKKKKRMPHCTPAPVPFITSNLTLAFLLKYHNVKGSKSIKQIPFHLLLLSPHFKTHPTLKKGC